MNNAALVHEFVSTLLSSYFVQDKAYVKDKNDLATLGIGSVISGGSGQPFENSPAGFREMIGDYQEAALRSRLKIPLLYGGDAVHGMSLSKETTFFPHNIGLGAANDPSLIEAIARATAIETSSTGVVWAFSPCVAVVRDCRWGRTYESFGEDADAVTANGVAHIKGLQGTAVQSWGVRIPGTVAACAKHYVGDGAVTFGTGQMGAKILDRGDVRLGEAEFEEQLRPDREAVKAGVMSIMVSFSSVQGKQMHAHRELIEGVLRQELGFQGLVVSDWAGHEQLRDGEGPVEKLALCINAGVDMIMIPEHYHAYQEHMQEALVGGLISPARLDEACARVLRLKHKLGLFSSQNTPIQDQNQALLAKVRCPAHLALARRAVQKSIVLLKNRACVLPLRKQILRHLFVCGKGADDMGLTCGGWSTSWQGACGPITTGTTILSALREGLPDTQVTYDATGEGFKPDQHQMVILVVAEDPPYAEWFGDRTDLYITAQEQLMVERVTNQGVPVIVVQLAGRPLLDRDNWAKVDALLHAWLPGSEGGYGIVDILCGDACPDGKMPLGLPEDLDVPKASRCMFAKGRGMTYDDDVVQGKNVPQPSLQREDT
jgi:beta-glucosidase